MGATELQEYRRGLLEAVTSAENCAAVEGGGLYNTVLFSAARVYDTSTVRDMIAKLESRGAIQTVHYDGLMKCLSHTKEAEDCANTLRKSLSLRKTDSDIHPTATQTHYLIKTLVNAGHNKEAKEAYRRMEKILTPLPGTLCLMIRLAKSKEELVGLNAVRCLKRNKMTVRDRETVQGELMLAFARFGHKRGVDHIARIVFDAGGFREGRPYVAMLEAYATLPERRIQWLWGCWKQMVGVGVTPNAEMYGVVLTALRKGARGIDDEAVVAVEKVFNHAVEVGGGVVDDVRQSGGGGGVHPILWSALFLTYDRVNDLNKMRVLFSICPPRIKAALPSQTKLVLETRMDVRFRSNDRMPKRSDTEEGVHL